MKFIVRVFNTDTEDTEVTICDKARFIDLLNHINLDKYVIDEVEVLNDLYQEDIDMWLKQNYNLEQGDF